MLGILGPRPQAPVRGRGLEGLGEYLVRSIPLVVKDSGVDLHEHVDGVTQTAGDLGWVDGRREHRRCC